MFAGGDVVRVGGVPLRDAGVEVPAVEVDALVGFEEFCEEFARAGECLAFEVDEAYDHVCYLNAGVVDVVLYAYFEAGFVGVGAEEALEGVAQDGVAEVADVGGFVGIDAGVLDEAEAGAADVGMLVGGDAAESGGAVEADVEVACAGYFYAGYSFGELRAEFCSEFGGDDAGGFAEALGQFEGYREGEFAEGDAGRLLDDEVRERGVVLGEEDGLDAGQQGLLNCAIHALRFTRRVFVFSLTRGSCPAGRVRYTRGVYLVVVMRSLRASLCSALSVFFLREFGGELLDFGVEAVCGCGCGCGG